LRKMLFPAMAVSSPTLTGLLCHSTTLPPPSSPLELSFSFRCIQIGDETERVVIFFCE
jgi:hypothetical protein